MIEGLHRHPLVRHEDERGWPGELARTNSLPKPIGQVNLGYSRRGVVRGLHYRKRGQDDVFVCPTGMVRVVLDPTRRETFCEDIGDENPVAICVPGRHPHGYEALTDALFGYLLTAEYDAEDPDEHGVPWNDPRIKHLWCAEDPIVSARDTP